MYAKHFFREFDELVSVFLDRIGPRRPTTGKVLRVIIVGLIGTIRSEGASYKVHYEFANLPKRAKVIG